MKRACEEPGCGPVCSAKYCLNANQVETIEVGCWKTGHSTDGYMTTSFTIDVINNSPPTIMLQG